MLTETVGRGRRRRRRSSGPDVDGRLPVVLFLHGWGATRPRYYGPWLDHLVREGNAVIYPRYQDSFVEPPPQVPERAGGVRLAFARVDEAPAARGGRPLRGRRARRRLRRDRERRLPVPVAVFSAYPGRRLPAAFGLPEIDPARIPASTRLVALAGTRDRVVGTRPARRLARRAGRAAAPLVVVSTRPPPTIWGRSGPTRPRAGSSGAAGPAHRGGALTHRVTTRCADPRGPSMTVSQ